MEKSVGWGQMLISLVDGLYQANDMVDMKTADVHTQEQYRRNAETILSLMTLFLKESLL